MALEFTFAVRNRDFKAAGGGVSELKRVLQEVGFSPGFIRRVTIAAFEAEMSIAIHA